MKIYIDIYFFINFAVDFLSLYWASRFIVLSYSTIRIFFASLIGGIWSVIFLFFPLLAPLHLPISYIMVLTSSGKKKSIKALLLFIFSEIIFGGTITALKSLFSFLPENKNGLLLIIIFGVTISFLSYDILEMYIKKKIRTVALSATILHKGKEKNLNLLIDSGNLARESMTKRRVIFIKESVISDIFEESELTFAIPIKTAAGSSIKYAFIPNGIHFADKKYNDERFIIVPDTEGCEFGGYDGIIGVI